MGPYPSISLKTCPKTTPSDGQGRKQAQDVEIYVSPTQMRLYSNIIADSGAATAREPVITPVFKTPAPDGPFRDEIVIEVLSINDNAFKNLFVYSSLN